MLPSPTVSGLGELMLAYASQNMTHDLLLQEPKMLEGSSLQQPERRDMHGEEDSMILHIKVLFCRTNCYHICENSTCCLVHLGRTPLAVVFIYLSTSTMQPCHRRYWTK
jgi:hypothetical protein